MFIGFNLSDKSRSSAEARRGKRGLLELPRTVLTLPIEEGLTNYILMCESQLPLTHKDLHIRVTCESPGLPPVKQ